MGDILFRILFHILFCILFNILFHILFHLFLNIFFCILVWILVCILFHILFCILFYILFTYFGKYLRTSKLLLENSFNLIFLSKIFRVIPSFSVFNFVSMNYYGKIELY